MSLVKKYSDRCKSIVSKVHDRDQLFWLKDRDGEGRVAWAKFFRESEGLSFGFVINKIWHMRVACWDLHVGGRRSAPANLAAARAAEEKALAAANSEAEKEQARKDALAAKEKAEKEAQEEKRRIAKEAAQANADAAAKKLEEQIKTKEKASMAQQEQDKKKKEIRSQKEKIK